MLTTTASGPLIAPNESIPAPLATVGQTSAPASQTAHPAEEDWQSPVAATALAVSALVLSEQHGGELGNSADRALIDQAYQGDLSEMLVGSMHWLAHQQRPDGGWGTGDSQLTTTMLVRAAFQLTGVPVAYPEMTEAMRRFIDMQGGLETLKRRYGVTSNTAILVRGSYALAEVIDWKQLPTIPLETAALPEFDSSAEFWSSRGVTAPAIVALGLASYQLHRPLNPLTNWRRGSASKAALVWLNSVQSANGSFGDSVSVTSMVLMSLASVGQTSTPLVRQGVEYLFSSVQRDGSWPGRAALNETELRG